MKTNTIAVLNSADGNEKGELYQTKTGDIGVLLSGRPDGARIDKPIKASANPYKCIRPAKAIFREYVQGA